MLIKALLFDVDGTIYRQAPVRLSMAFELLSLALRNPKKGMEITWLLHIFRRERERLRQVEAMPSLETFQFERVGEITGASEEKVQAIVEEWICRRPLDYLPRFVRPGLEDLLEWCSDNDVLVGALSDYPPQPKLKTMALENRFSLQLCSTDPGIGALKPSPLGIISACRVWGLEPEKVLYLGDRPGVDGKAAAAARCPFVLVGRRSRNQSILAVMDFYELRDYLQRLK